MVVYKRGPSRSTKYKIFKIFSIQKGYPKGSLQGLLNDYKNKAC